MLGEVAAVLSAISALNSGIATLKEGKGNLDSIVGKWAEADEQYRDVEKSKAGAMSYKEALRMESAKRQLENFDQQLKIIKIRKAKLKKDLKLAGTILFAWIFFMALLFAGIWIYRQP